MHPRDLKAWRAYELVEPWGEARMDRRFGKLMAQIANLWAERPAGRFFTWRDFYPAPVWDLDAPAVASSSRAAPSPRPGGPPARQTPEEMQAIMASFVALHHQTPAARKGWAPSR